MSVQFPQSTVSIALAAALAMGSGLAMAQATPGSSGAPDAAAQPAPGGDDGAPSGQPAEGADQMNQGSADEGAAGASDASSSEGSDDDQITEQVQDKLASEGIGDDIDVATQDGVVTLKGEVASDDDVQKAEEAAQGVDGVQDVKTSDLKAK